VAPSLLGERPGMSTMGAFPFSPQLWKVTFDLFFAPRRLRQPGPSNLERPDVSLSPLFPPRSTRGRFSPFLRLGPSLPAAGRAR